MQTGATQGAVVEALGKRGYTIPGGGRGTPASVASPWAAVGWLARGMGLACDNLVGLEMVIASGGAGRRVIQPTRATMRPPVGFTRGRSGDLGVATSYTLKVHPISPVTFSK